MTSVKPIYQEEYDRQEYELEKLYQIFVEKFKNLVYLEHVQMLKTNKHKQYRKRRIKYYKESEMQFRMQKQMNQEVTLDYNQQKKMKQLIYEITWRFQYITNG